MEDTTKESRRLVFDIIMSKNVEERFLICAELYEEAKEFAKLGMPERLSLVDQKAYVFRRIHGAAPGDLVRFLKEQI